MLVFRAVICFGLLIAGLSPAHADISEAREWFGALPLQQRFAIQSSLVVTDEYVALADGVLGRMTYDALLSFQRRHGQPLTGILSPGDVSVLVREAEKFYADVGFNEVDDISTGLMLRIPLALLTRTSRTSRGTRWLSPDATAEMQSISMPNGEQSYKDLFARMKSDDENRRVTYKVFSDEFFVVAGDEGGRHFYARFMRTAADTRGFSLAWVPSRDGTFRRLTIAIANSMKISEGGRGGKGGGPNADPADADPETPVRNKAIPQLEAGTAFGNASGCKIHRDDALDNAPEDTVVVTSDRVHRGTYHCPLRHPSEEGTPMAVTCSGKGEEWPATIRLFLNPAWPDVMVYSESGPRYRSEFVVELNRCD